MSDASVVVEHESRPKLGESANGDAVVVRRFDDDTLVAVVDALGHGPRAEAVARKAVAFLTELEHAIFDDNAEGAMRRLHEALRGTRGAAATICLIRGSVLDACGVGNVEMRCVGTSIPVQLSPGIVGVKMRRLRQFSGTLRPRSRCYVFSDGVSRHAPFAELSAISAREACTRLIANHRHDHDDASVAVLAIKEQA